MGGPCQITKNQINIELIEIVQFCLTIDGLWKHAHLWVGVWVNGWVNGWLMDVIMSNYKILSKS